MNYNCWLCYLKGELVKTILNLVVFLEDSVDSASTDLKVTISRDSSQHGQLSHPPQAWHGLPLVQGGWDAAEDVFQLLKIFRCWAGSPAGQKQWLSINYRKTGSSSIGVTFAVSSLGWVDRDLSDFDIIFDSTKRLKEPSLPIFGCSRLCFGEEHLSSVLDSCLDSEISGNFSVGLFSLDSYVVTSIFGIGKELLLFLGFGLFSLL